MVSDGETSLEAFVFDDGNRGRKATHSTNIRHPWEIKKNYVAYSISSVAETRDRALNSFSKGSGFYEVFPLPSSPMAF